MVKRENRVREFRVKSGISGNEIARKVDLDSDTLRKIERGLTTSRETALRIIKALGLEPQELDVVFPNGVSKFNRRVR